ncbi:MAG: inorganic pyrophosphatase [Oscillospiraceae bacterium]|jgi:inorganic pyrophosphatase|nr:inorganic pyrophosphatase [Oscillospiraceae bacterium]
MSDNQAFWVAVDALIAASRIVIDRARGSTHPHFDYVYPLDYGYLADTASSDGDGIDVWRGSLPDPMCDAILCTVDLMKRDSEIKLLIGCTEDEKAVIMRAHNNTEFMKGVMIRREVR